MTCREFAEFMAEYLQGELPPQPRLVFEAHLKICKNCQVYLTIYQDTVRLGRSAFDGADEDPVPAEVPDRLVRAILAARERNPM